jgi:DNA-binding IclR family transcriptional regulator
MTTQRGERREAHAGASSKILMAYLPEQEIAAIIREGGLPRLCTNTIVDPDQLRAELANIRECGYAESHEETDLGAWGIATPIRDQDGNVAAGAGIAGPSSRFTPELRQQWVVLCQQAAEQISAQLGGGIDPR